MRKGATGDTKTNKLVNIPTEMSFLTATNSPQHNPQTSKTRVDT